MCGVVGVVDLNNRYIEKEDIISITDLLEHRGPDNGGYWVQKNVGLGHRRLSILDLSELADQPLQSSDGRFVIVYNGEVYNFLDLKRELLEQGFNFKSHSDTEVILNGFVLWGDSLFKKLNGMFAIAIYDRIENKLVLARDRYGIKPLYIYHDSDVFVFASEIKSILSYERVRVSINKQALSEYIWFGNPLGNNTIYDEINELSPGIIMTLKNGTIQERRYYSIYDTKEVLIDEDDAIKQLSHLLEDSVKRHLVSDVPVGVFLSGGIDSSAITAYASRHYSKKLNTYSVAFDFAKGPNELDKARNVASIFGTKHNEIRISGQDTISVIEKLVHSHDEPFADAANIPLYLLTEKVKGDVSVVLQGDGGDEFFGGYSRYHTVYSKKKYQFLKYVAPFVDLLGLKNNNHLRLLRFNKAINEKDQALRNALLLTMESTYSNPIQVFNRDWKKELSSLDPFKRYRDIYNQYSNNMDETQALFYTDTQIILKDTFFEKVDKSTMANSVEVRIPFLDNELTDFALSLPSRLKIKNGIQKYLLKKALEGVVPNDILYGKKTGFSVPYAFWLGTTLKDYFLQQLDTSKVKEIIDTDRVKKLLKYHSNSRGNYGFVLWKVFIFCIWFNQNDKIN